jgi:small subunit ribosomal protein S5
MRQQLPKGCHAVVRVDQNALSQSSRTRLLPLIVLLAWSRGADVSVTLVLGNKKGSVGVGTGKASDTALAIEKAMRNARKRVIRVNLTKNLSIPYDVSAKYGASKVEILPAPGRGLVAGSSVRNVLELAGITDVTAKILSRSKNRLNNARAAIAALKQLRT